MPSSAGGGVQQYKSQIKYSDKPRLARFRNFATEFFDKRGLDGAMSVLIGDVVLNGQLSEEGERCRRDHEERRWDEGPPLLATPIATPLQGGRPERAGLFVFLFLKLPGEMAHTQCVARW